MGNNIGVLASENINQTEISAINQKCNVGVNSVIQDITITAIDSHIGNIELTNSVNVGDMSCVMAAVSAATTVADVTNTAAASISALPLQATINNIDVQDYTTIQSYQQSLIDQSCIESVAADTTDVQLTFIDTSTGNIKIANQVAVSSLSCNLQASSYQSASARVVDSTTAKISSGCCGFGLGMLVPVVIAVIGVAVLSKVMKKDAGGGGSTTDPNMSLITQLGAQVSALGPSRSGSVMGGMPPPATAASRASTMVKL